MTYEELFHLKFKNKLTTHELIRRYPQDTLKVSQVALLDVPSRTLERVIAEKTMLKQIMRLKKRFSRFL